MKYIALSLTAALALIVLAGCNTTTKKTWTIPAPDDCATCCPTCP